MLMCLIDHVLGKEQFTELYTAALVLDGVFNNAEIHISFQAAAFQIRSHFPGGFQDVSASSNIYAVPALIAVDQLKDIGKNYLILGSVRRIIDFWRNFCF